ncbi:hypothetical protein [Rubinisphaera margarita]|uniref:hypothetical protein n=1 Tax=Rubinisphaera margarita TaxID=2909586 RepID=UPI001EE81A1D|nr:hypothetical protein [Rubinisphaera margarita]MCG6154750.1 hypothetical protein [Rubinisphaera margarita]
MAVRTESNPVPVNVLTVGASCPDWGHLLQQLETCGLQLAEAQWVATFSEAFPFLRTEAWNCLVISADRAQAADIERGLHALEEMQLQPAIVVTGELEVGHWLPICRRHQACLSIDRNGWFGAEIGLRIEQAIRTQTLQQELGAIRNELRIRRERDREEAELILSQQHRLLHEIVHPEPGRPERPPISSLGIPPADTPELSQFQPRYDQLLKTVILDGLRSSQQELKDAIAEFRSTLASPGQLLSVHLRAVESLLTGTGNRSSRHILQRADQLLVEAMVCLAEDYRRNAA